MTVYTSNKPDAGPSPLLDAPIIQANFATFNTVFSNTVGSNLYDHTALNSPFQGHHESVVMVNQTQAPGVNQNLAVLFNMNATSHAGTQPQLWVQIPKFLPNEFDTTNAQNAPMLLTYGSVNTAGPIFFTFLPGGYLLYFGIASYPTLTITLTPTPTQILIAGASARNTTGGHNALVSTVVLSASSFQIFSDATVGATFGWYAIATA